MINVGIWLAAGGLIGWLTSVIMYTDGQRDLFRNVAAGVFGAAIGGWLISPHMGVGAIHQSMLNVGALVVSLVVSVVLLAIINVLRRDPVS